MTLPYYYGINFYMFDFLRKIGLVLGSGTARGLAHIGVLKVLEREKIKIGWISGASIGALIGAIYSLNQDLAVLEKEVLKVDWFKVLSFLHLGYGHGGLMDSSKVEEFLRHFVGRKTFKDLKIPLAIAAVDLKTGEEIIFQEGPLFEAVRASIALPGLFTPLEFQSRVLVDGGLLLPMPVAACRKLGARKILGVNLFEDLADSFQKFNLSDIKGQTNTLNVGQQAFFIMENKLAQIENSQADLVISPALGKIDWFDFTRAREFIATGEQTASQNMAAIKKLTRLF